MTKYSPNLLMGAVNRNSFNELGTVKVFERAVVIGHDYKRQWAKEPKNAKELLQKHYTSKPWVYNQQFHDFNSPEAIVKKLTKLGTEGKASQS
jgi:hypothetical protein